MSEVLEVDLIVIGGGMAGMSAAGYASDHGLQVVVVEKGPEPGGSAVRSNGTVWTAETYEVAREVNPDGDPELVRTLVENYEDAVEWVRTTGVEMSDRQSLLPINGFPSRGYTVDILGYMQRSAAKVSAAGGHVVTSSEVESLVIDDGKVVGAMVRDRDGVTEIRAPWVLFAAGGFQNDPELRGQFLGGERGKRLMVRSNPNSDGTGLRLARSAGGTISEQKMDSFYGHVVPYPLERPWEPRDDLRLAQLYSGRGVLLDQSGERFVDESIAYHQNGRAVHRSATGRALLVADEETLALDRSGYGLTEQIDRIAEARKEGANVAQAHTLEELATLVEPWGYRNVAEAIQSFNEQVAEDPGKLDPPRTRNQRPVSVAPFYAMEVQPAITFTMGGIRVDTNARVLDENGEPVPGLLAAGAEIGGIYYDAYLGGLSLALVFGLQAAKTAVGEAS